MFIWRRLLLYKSSRTEVINVEAEVVYFVDFGKVVDNETEEVYQFSVDEHEASLIIVLKWLVVFCTSQKK